MLLVAVPVLPAPRRAQRQVQRPEGRPGGVGIDGTPGRVGVAQRAEQRGQRTGWQRRGRPGAGEELGADHAGGVQVLGGGGRAALEELGRQEPVGAHRAGDAREAAVAGDHRHAEVGEQQPGATGAGGLQEQVGRLHVTVDDPGTVHRGQGVEQLVEQGCGVRRRERAVLGEQVLDGAAADQAGGQGDAVVLGDPPDGGQDVRVPHAHRLLAHEAQQRGRPGVVLAEDLQGHLVAGTPVHGPPHRAHAPGAEVLAQQVATADQAVGAATTAGEREHRRGSYPGRGDRTRAGTGSRVRAGWEGAARRW